MSWEVILVEEVDQWFLGLCRTDPGSAELVEAAINVLEMEGPTLGRPLADRVRSSRHHNMKELRPGSTRRSEIRILFAFDPSRQAILLVAGDKAGNWAEWYQQSVPIADDRYDQHLDELKEVGQ